MHAYAFNMTTGISPNKNSKDKKSYTPWRIGLWCFGILVLLGLQSCILKYIKFQKAVTVDLVTFLEKLRNSEVHNIVLEPMMPSLMYFSTDSNQRFQYKVFSSLDYSSFLKDHYARYLQEQGILSAYRLPTLYEDVNIIDNIWSIILNPATISVIFMLMCISSMYRSINMNDPDVSSFEENMTDVKSFCRVTLAKDLEKDKGVSFKDIGGLGSLKDKLSKIVRRLKDKTQLHKVAHLLPKGIMFYGGPGLGKTMTAKALAKEAGCNFIYVCAADISAIFASVPSIRVRRLYKEAVRLAPCIVFIDEIDTIGNRTASIRSCDNEVINQLLTQLDGFNISSGVITIGATNLIENLDPALLRSGRFDQKVEFSLPTVSERKEIIGNIIGTLDMQVDASTDDIVAITCHSSGADIRSIFNQAYLSALDNNEDVVRYHRIYDAMQALRSGLDISAEITVSDSIVNTTAYHEAGHAIVASVLPNKRVYVEFVTISPKNLRTGGYTLILPKDQDDTSFYTKEDITSHIAVAMGGRAAEEIIFGKENIGTGAAADIALATRVAQDMITKYGLSDEVQHMVLDMNKCSESMRAIIEKQVQDVCIEAYNLALSLVKKHIGQLHTLASRLKEKKSLYKQEVQDIIDMSENDKSSPTAVVADKEEVSDSNPLDPINHTAEEKSSDTAQDAQYDQTTESDQNAQDSEVCTEAHSQH